MLVFVVGRVGETGFKIGKGGPCLNGDQVACVFCKLCLLLSSSFFFPHLSLTSIGFQVEKLCSLYPSKYIKKKKKQPFHKTTIKCLH